MSIINVKEVLDKLIELTKNGTLPWEYLDSEQNICSNLNYVGVSPMHNRSAMEKLATVASSKKVFDADNSFITSINDNHIIIYCNLNDDNDEKTLDERLIFMLVPRTYKDVFMYASDGNDGTLLRLHSLVKSNFPSAQDIVDDILGL